MIGFADGYGSCSEAPPQITGWGRAKDQSFVVAIARELSKICGETLVEHLFPARSLLEKAFRSMEQNDRMSTSAYLPAGSGDQVGSS